MKMTPPYNEIAPDAFLAMLPDELEIQYRGLEKFLSTGQPLIIEKNELVDTKSDGLEEQNKIYIFPKGIQKMNHLTEHAIMKLSFEVQGEGIMYRNNKRVNTGLISYVFTQQDINLFSFVSTKTSKLTENGYESDEALISYHDYKLTTIGLSKGQKYLEITYAELRKVGAF